MFISLLANHRCRCTHPYRIALLLCLAMRMCNARQPAVAFKFERYTAAAHASGTATTSMHATADNTAAARSNEDQTTGTLKKTNAPQATTTSSHRARARLGTRAGVTFIDCCWMCCMGYSYRPWRRRSGFMSLKATAESSNFESKKVTFLLQSICDKISEGGGLRDIENLVAEVEGSMFSQADAWGKTWAPMRSMIAQVPDTLAISVLALPRGTRLEWQRHDNADSISSLLFGNVAVTSLELESSDASRKLEQQELEATHADAWAVGGSDESDCVCRGGRCPRMWDCPFWVERRRAEAKGSSAHVARKTARDGPHTSLWRAGHMTVRRIEALAPSALLEVHLGPRNSRYYQQIDSTIEDAVELIEALAPVGVKPWVGRYLGPGLHLPS